MKIIVIDNDEVAAGFIIKGLTQAGHCVELYRDGRDALIHCMYLPYDLIVMDRAMPGMDGLSVLKALRLAGREEPILFLSRMTSVDDRVEGLLAGADDYLTKPYHFSELLARITVLGRRPRTAPAAPRLEVAGLHLDLLSRTATREGVAMDLKPKEFALLEVLMRNEGRIITKTVLLERLWNFNFDPNTTVIETNMSRLRAKVDKPFRFPLIHTIRGVGYSLHVPR